MKYTEKLKSWAITLAVLAVLAVVIGVLQV